MSISFCQDQVGEPEKSRKEKRFSTGEMDIDEPSESKWSGFHTNHCEFMQIHGAAAFMSDGMTPSPARLIFSDTSSKSMVSLCRKRDPP
jgi:hypothetical protein